MLSTMTAMKRPEFREKFVELSEELFKEGSTLPFSDSFWDDYLILPVNVKCLTRLIQNKSEENLLDLKKNLSALFGACLDKLDPPSQQDYHDQHQKHLSPSETTRQRNSITILTVLFRGLFIKKRLNHYNILSILTKEQIDDADVLFNRLITAVEATILFNNNSLRSDALQLALILVCGNDNVNENGVNGYFMNSDIFNTLIKIITEENQIKENDFHDILMLIGILSNYNKYEFKNVYLSKIRTLNNPSAFRNIINIYTKALQRLTQRYIDLNDDEETFSNSVISFVSKWFSSSTQLPSTTTNNATAAATPTDGDSVLFSSLPSAQVVLLLPLYELISNNSKFVKAIVDTCTRIDREEKDDSVSQVMTFFTSFLSFSTYLFENNRTERTNIYSRLLLIILLRLIEENDVLSYFSKEESYAIVRLCRHRSPPLPSVTTTAKRRSLFCAVLDAMLLFVRHNVKSRLDLISYKYAFSVIYRVLCFLNKHKIRLEYHWCELWTTLTSHTQFTALHLDDLKNRSGFDLYLVSFISIFNMCVTHGETFLPDTKSYDRLYYELIRATNAFITIADYVKSEKFKENERGPVTIAANEIQNLQLIVNHLKPAIDEWQTEKRIKYPTPEQVMSVINERYATLELKPADRIVSYIIFKEIPNEMGFFRHLLRIGVVDYLNFYTASNSLN